MDAIEKIKSELGINGNPSLDTIIKFQDVLIAKEDDADDDELRICLENAMNEAVKNLLTMRVKEGIQLKDDISLSLVKIRELMEVISENSHTIVEDYKIKFEDRIKELLGNTHELDENRLYNEIVIYADKSDINEEIVRFNSHMVQLSDALDSGGAI